MGYPDVQADELYDMGKTPRVCGNCSNGTDLYVMDEDDFDTWKSEVNVYCAWYEAEVETSHEACEEFEERW